MRRILRRALAAFAALTLIAPSPRAALQLRTAAPAPMGPSFALTVLASLPQALPAPAPEIPSASHQATALQAELIPPAAAPAPLAAQNDSLRRTFDAGAQTQPSVRTEPAESTPPTAAPLAASRPQAPVPARGVPPSPQSIPSARKAGLSRVPAAALLIATASVIAALSSIPFLNSGLRYDLLLRKAAHMTEFGLLFIFSRQMTPRSWSSWARTAAAFFAAVAYAAADEWHQTFVPGRHGCVTDVMIDASGAALAAGARALWARKR